MVFYNNNNVGSPYYKTEFGAFISSSTYPCPKINKRTEFKLECTSEALSLVLSYSIGRGDGQFPHHFQNFRQDLFFICIFIFQHFQNASFKIGFIIVKICLFPTFQQRWTIKKCCKTEFSNKKVFFRKLLLHCWLQRHRY